MDFEDLNEGVVIEQVEVCEGAHVALDATVREAFRSICVSAQKGRVVASVDDRYVCDR